jgi:hypothetical protein
VQRELLLDTMVQHTPVAMLLLDGGRIQRVVHGNLAARKLLGNGWKLEGQAVRRTCWRPCRWSCAKPAARRRRHVHGTRAGRRR